MEFLLRIAHSHIYLYTEFIRKDYINIIGTIIRTSKCYKGIHLLNSILETACSVPVLTKRNNTFCIINNSKACVIYPNLLMSIFEQYSNWNENKYDCKIIETLLNVIENLVREKHPQQNLNLLRLSKAKLISTLFHFCKIHLIGTTHAIYLTKSAAKSIVNIIRIFGGAPPTPSILDDIIKLLLLLHRPSDSFVTHDRLKFYFLLTPQSSSSSSSTTSSSSSSKHSTLKCTTVPLRRKSTEGIVGNYTIKILRSASFSQGYEYNRKNNTNNNREESGSRNERRFSEQMHTIKNIAETSSELQSHSEENNIKNESLSLSSEEKILVGKEEEEDGTIKQLSSNIFNNYETVKLDKAFKTYRMRHQLTDKMYKTNRRRRIRSHSSRNTSGTGSETENVLHKIKKSIYHFIFVFFYFI